MNILVVDVGGSSVKLWHTAHEEHRKFESGPELTPEELAEEVTDHAADWEYEAIALGLPCRVSGGRPVDEPINLGPGWVGFNYASALERPVRMMNDATLQALGSYDGGRMLFMSLGTGVGSAFIAPGLIVSLDLGRTWFHDAQVRDLMIESELQQLTVKGRRKLIHQVVPALKAMMMADYVVLGGGGSNLLDELPDGCRRGHNRTVVEGGRRLWEELPDPIEKIDSWIVQ